VGRAARNVNGRAIMYADVVTASMQQAINETERRRGAQEAYNHEHGITPASIIKNIDDVMSSVYERDYLTVPAVREAEEEFRTQDQLDAFVAELQLQMKAAAANLEFEKAATLRDRVKRLRSRELGLVGNRL
jgi:excinuclease ABC subunit B